MSRRRISASTNHSLIGSLKEISFFILLVLSSILCIVSIAYFQSQFDPSPTQALYKEIAEDYYPSAVCDKNGTIHVVWQSDRNGNWDIYYTPLEDRHKKEFENLTINSDDDTFPSIAEDEKGNIWAVWVRYGSNGSSIYGKILDNQKSSWSGEIEFIPRVDYELRSPSLISIDSERMLLAWILRKEEKYEIEYAILDSAKLSRIKSSKTLPLTSHNSRKIVLGKTKAGKIFALWDSMQRERSELRYSLFDEESKNFTDLLQLKFPDDKPFIGDTPSVVIRSEKPSILFFHSEDWDICSSVVSSEDGPGFPKFPQPKKFRETAALEDCPAALETNDGEVYLFWASNYTGDNEIFFCHSYNQNDFGTKEDDSGTKEDDSGTKEDDSGTKEDDSGTKEDDSGTKEPSDERGPLTIDEEKKQFVKNLTMDPNQNNRNRDDEYCRNIFFSVAAIEDELWIAWDSYHWDLTELNNRRTIKCIKTSDEEGIDWEPPIIVVDSRKSKKKGRDDRHPAIVGTTDRIWIFWHSDRYRTEEVENYEICYILSENGGDSWKWKDESKDIDPNLLTEGPAKDILPSVSAIGDRIFVVWASEESGNSEILLCEFDGNEGSEIEPIKIEGDPNPKWHPFIATYGGWHLFSLGYTEELMIAWESIAEGCFICQFKTIDISENVFSQDRLNPDEFYTKMQQNTNFHFPSIFYISRHPLLKKILRNRPWVVWQYGKPIGGKFDIQCKNRFDSREEIGLIQVTDDLSANERPQIVEFEGKVWVFWDSNGGGNERGIYYRYYSRKEIPSWLSGYSYVLGVCWILFFLDIRSKGGVRKLILNFSMWIDRIFHRHVGLRDVIIGVVASSLTYILLRFMGTFLDYLFG